MSYAPPPIELRGGPPPSRREHAELYQHYLRALSLPIYLQSVVTPDFWAHDLMPERLPGSEGSHRFIEFRKDILAAFRLASGIQLWLPHSQSAEIAGLPDEQNLVGAHLHLEYVHDQGPFTPPGSDVQYEPTGMSVVVEVDEVLRLKQINYPPYPWFASDRWAGNFDPASINQQLAANAQQ